MNTKKIARVNAKVLCITTNNVKCAKATLLKLATSLSMSVCLMTAQGYKTGKVTVPI
jgi:hypothetical protein